MSKTLKRNLIVSIVFVLLGALLLSFSVRLLNSFPTTSGGGSADNTPGGDSSGDNTSNGDSGGSSGDSSGSGGSGGSSGGTNTPGGDNTGGDNSGNEEPEDDYWVNAQAVTLSSSDNSATMNDDYIVVEPNCHQNSAYLASWKNVRLNEYFEVEFDFYLVEGFDLPKFYIYPTVKDAEGIKLSMSNDNADNCNPCIYQNGNFLSLEMPDQMCWYEDRYMSSFCHSYSELYGKHTVKYVLSYEANGWDMICYLDGNVINDYICDDNCATRFNLNFDGQPYYLVGFRLVFNTTYVSEQTAIRVENIRCYAF